MQIPKHLGVVIIFPDKISQLMLFWLTVLLYLIIVMCISSWVDVQTVLNKLQKASRKNG